MIFITLGSQKFQFDRILRFVDNLFESGKIKDEVFAQIGFCKYRPKHFKYCDFLDRDTFLNKMNNADIVITHGGTGVIVSALRSKKRVIAIPRLVEFNEHVDNHQKQIINNFVEKNYILTATNEKELGERLRMILDWNFDIFESNNGKYISFLTNYIKG